MHGLPSAFPPTVDMADGNDNRIKECELEPQSLIRHFIRSICLQNSWFVIHCEWRRCGKKLWHDAHTSISNPLGTKPLNYRPLIFYQREIIFNLAKILFFFKRYLKYAKIHS